MITENMLQRMELYTGAIAAEGFSSEVITPASNKEDESIKWFYGIEESTIELRNRYNMQEESIRGWDDF